jgi:hypothetical protein
LVQHRRILCLILIALVIVFGCNSLWSQTYEDKAWCYSVSVPPDWRINARAETTAHFIYNRDAAFHITADPNQPPVTLAHSLERLKDGGFKNYIESVKDIQVDGEPALWVTISPALDYRYIVVVVNPNCSSMGLPLFILTNQEDPRELTQFLKNIQLK